MSETQKQQYWQTVEVLKFMCNSYSDLSNGVIQIAEECITTLERVNNIKIMAFMFTIRERFRI